jgi:hypothetical protein
VPRERCEFFPQEQCQNIPRNQCINVPRQAANVFNALLIMFEIAQSLKSACRKLNFTHG